MVSTKEVHRQFRNLGVRPSFLARAEIKELGNVLMPGEQLKHVVFGWYDNGFALLCATEHRVLLIDKKMFFLKLEDLRYDKISEVRFTNRLLDSHLCLAYIGKDLVFKSLDQSGLRKLMEYTQETIMKINRFQWSMDQQPPAQQFTPRQPEPTRSVAAASEPTQPKPGLPYDVAAYPEDLAQRAREELGLTRNPYHKQGYMRRHTTPQQTPIEAPATS